MKKSKPILLVILLFVISFSSAYGDNELEIPKLENMVNPISHMETIHSQNLAEKERIKKENELKYFSDTILIKVTKEERQQIEKQLEQLKPEIEMMAKVIYREGGGEDLLYQSTVAWCILNRVDSSNWSNTISGVLTSPNQFAWYPNTQVYEEQLTLAKDVVTRWLLEKMGKENVQRTLPNDYFYFAGDGVHNYFRKNFKWDGTYWDWSLPDPYAEW